MKAKLQEQLPCKYKDRKVYEQVLAVPDEAITELGWKGGQNVDFSVKDGKLLVELKMRA